MAQNLEQLCKDKKILLTDQRKAILDVISNSDDHPDVEELHRRASKLDAKISIATVYRTLKLLEENAIIQKHDFVCDDRSRYEPVSEEHHDHIINVKTGEVTEFFSPEIEKMQEKIAAQYGYKIVDHRMELYVIPTEK